MDAEFLKRVFGCGVFVCGDLVSGCGWRVVSVGVRGWVVVGMCGCKWDRWVGDGHILSNKRKYMYKLNLHSSISGSSPTLKYNFAKIITNTQRYSSKNVVHPSWKRAGTALKLYPYLPFPSPYSFFLLTFPALTPRPTLPSPYLQMVGLTMAV